MNTLRYWEWNVLLLAFCVACANSGGEGMETSPTAPGVPTQATGPSSAGHPATATTTTTTATAGAPASASGASKPATAAMTMTAAATGAAGAVATAPTHAAAGSAAAAAGSTAPAGAQSSAGAPSSGAAGSHAGAAGSGESAPASGSEGKVKHACLKAPGDMVFIGDSYVNYVVAHTELNILVANDAVKDGALMQGQVYPDYAVAGTTLAAPPAAIQDQWPQAKTANKDIKFVVMDGGGNDVLINNMQCKVDGAASDPTCQMVVQNSLDAAKKMMSDMKASGVTEVVYFFYPHPPTGGWEIDDYTIPKLEDVCKGLVDSKFQCRIVNTVPIFMGHDDWYAADGIHANDVGEQAIADAVWKALKDDCAAQAASSGCCTQ